MESVSLASPMEKSALAIADGETQIDGEFKFGIADGENASRVFADGDASLRIDIQGPPPPPPRFGAALGLERVLAQYSCRRSARP